VHADEHPRRARLVEPDDDLLAAPGRGQGLEPALIGPRGGLLGLLRRALLLDRLLRGLLGLLLALVLRVRHDGTSVRSACPLWPVEAYARRMALEWWGLAGVGGRPGVVWSP